MADVERRDKGRSKGGRVEIKKKVSYQTQQKRQTFSYEHSLSRSKKKSKLIHGI